MQPIGLETILAPGTSLRKFTEEGGILYEHVEGENVKIRLPLIFLNKLLAQTDAIFLGLVLFPYPEAGVPF